MWSIPTPFEIPAFAVLINKHLGNELDAEICFSAFRTNFLVFFLKPNILGLTFI